MNVSDYFNTSKIDDINFPTFNDMMAEGIFGFGYSPFTDIMGGFFWGVTFCIIGIAIYSWKGLYPTIGYFTAIALITAAVLPASIFLIIGIFLAFLITAILYRLFIQKKGKRSRNNSNSKSKKYMIIEEMGGNQ